MRTTGLIEELRELLKRDHVTFVEMSQLDGFKGDLEMLLKGEKCSNIVIWEGISKEAEAALKTICEEGEYELAPATVLTYLVDGAMLKLPLATRARHYKKPHWLPMQLRRKA